MKNVAALSFRIVTVLALVVGLAVLNNVVDKSTAEIVQTSPIPSSQLVHVFTVENTPGHLLVEGLASMEQCSAFCNGLNRDHYGQLIALQGQSVVDCFCTEERTAK